MKTSDRISTFFSSLSATAKGVAKIMIQSRRPSVKRQPRSGRMIILGNGPSLAKTIADDGDILRSSDCMAVNFMANMPQFRELRPNHYILCDPHFFTGHDDANVGRLWRQLAAVDWPMTLYLPAALRRELPVELPRCVTVEFYNPVGIEGFDAVSFKAFDAGRAMPRPRNVLIPALMVAILAGWKRIAVVGADHSWSSSLWVDDENHVVTVQPHFYKDDEKERERVRDTYRNVRLHDIMLSFHIAFKAYHDIARYAASRGVEIINATPGSFIDAFDRDGL